MTLMNESEQREAIALLCRCAVFFSHLALDEEQPEATELREALSRFVNRVRKETPAPEASVS